jgi:carbon monoxide dehydrogenase subunit G
MDLVHRFSVQAPIDEAWYALNHIDRLAPCFPGASIDSFSGDEFTGSVKIKFGPTLDYRGSGKFLERDDAEHKAVVEARGSDLHGGSGVLAGVTVEMWENGRLTDVVVKTDLGISGRPAQLGRGVIEDVSNKLMLAFVDRLQDRFDAGIGRPDYAAPAPPPAQKQASPAPSEPKRAAGPAGPDGTETAAAVGTAAGGERTGPTPRHRYPRTSLSDAPPTSTAGSAAATAGPVAAPQYGTAFPQDEPALNLITALLPSVLKRYGIFIAAGMFVLWVVTRVARRGKKK